MNGGGVREAQSVASLGTVSCGLDGIIRDELKTLCVRVQFKFCYFSLNLLVTRVCDGRYGENIVRW